MKGHYQLAEEDQHSFTVRHPDGSHFKIAKQALQDAMHEKIRSIPGVKKMSAGGEVDPIADNASSVPSDQDVLNNLIAGAPVTSESIDNSQSVPVPLPPGYDHSGQGGADIGGAISSLASNVKGGLSSFAQGAKGAELLGAQSPTPDSQTTRQIPAPPAQALPNGGPPQGALPQATPDSLKNYLASQGQIGGGIMGVAKAEQEKGVAEAKAAQDAQDQLATLAAETKQRATKLDMVHDQLVQQIKTGQTDPNRLWNNTSTGNKIIASIGLILGGIGSGLTGRPNAALEVMQNAVNHDIEAQKSDLGKTQSLLSMNMERTRDLNQAELATRLQINASLQAQLQKAAAISGSKQAMANAQIALGQLKQQQVGFTQQLALMQTQAQSLGAGGGQGGLPVGGEPLQMLGDKEYQQKRIVIGNRAFQAASPDDAKDLKNMQAEYEPVKSMVSQLNNLGPSALVPGSAENLKAQALRASLVPRLNKLHGLNRLSEEDIKLMGNQIKDPTAFSQMLNGGLKDSQFLNNLNEDLDSNYKTRLIGYKGPSSYKSFNKLGQVGQ